MEISAALWTLWLEEDSMALTCAEVETKNHVKENMRRIRQIQQASQQHQQQQQTGDELKQPVKALWKLSQFDTVPSRIKEQLQVDLLHPWIIRCKNPILRVAIHPLKISVPKIFMRPSKISVQFCCLLSIARFVCIRNVHEITCIRKIFGFFLCWLFLQNTQILSSAS